MLTKAALFFCLTLTSFAGFCQSNGDCAQIQFPVLEFLPNSITFTQTSQVALSGIAFQIKGVPACRIVVAGNAGGTKVDQQLSWDHVNAVIQYLSDKENIARNSFIFQLQGSSGINEVSLRVANANEDGPSSVAPPFPDMMKK